MGNTVRTNLPIKGCIRNDFMLFDDLSSESSCTPMVPIHAEGFQHCQHQAALETKPLARAGSRLLDSRLI